MVNCYIIYLFTIQKVLKIIFHCFRVLLGPVEDVVVVDTFNEEVELFDFTATLCAGVFTNAEVDKLEAKVLED
jgi:hypothetical protein